MPTTPQQQQHTELVHHSSRRGNAFAPEETLDPLGSVEAVGGHGNEGRRVGVPMYRPQLGLPAAVPSSSPHLDAHLPAGVGRQENGGVASSETNTNGGSDRFDAVEALRAVAYMLGSPVQRRQYGERGGADATNNSAANAPSRIDRLVNDAGSQGRTHSSSGNRTMDEDDDATSALCALLEMGVNAERIVSLVRDR